MPFQIPSCEQLPALQRFRQDSCERSLNLLEIVSRVGDSANLNGLNGMYAQFSAPGAPCLHLFATWLN